jgi:DNA-binding transcriptional LysR family regulator
MRTQVIGDDHLCAAATDHERRIQQFRGRRSIGHLPGQRHPAGLRLTTAGESLLHAAGRWTREFADQGVRAGGDLAPQVRAPLYSREDNGADSIHIPAAIARGDVDFGIMLNPRVSRELEVRAHAEIKLGLLTRAKHPLARQKGIRFSVCAEYPIVAPAEALALCEHVRGLEAATGVTSNTVAASDNIHMIKSLIAQDLGLGVLTWLDVADEVRRGELAFIPLARTALPALRLAVCVDPARQLCRGAAAAGLG